MKKMLKNKKGFSLIELLIVIAIMGVLAVIAFSMFSGVVSNSRKKADRTQGGNIQKALVAYIVDTGDAYLESLVYPTTIDENANKNDPDDGVVINGTTHSWEEVCIALQCYQKVGDEIYEPFLNPKNGATPSSVDFKVQWTGHAGYTIDVFPERMNATVVPVESGAALIIPSRP